MSSNRKQKLLIVAGAGSSLDFGFPSCAEIHSLFENLAQKQFPLAENPKSNLYKFIYDQISKGNSNYINFEKVLYNIYSLQKYLTTALFPFNVPLIQLPNLPRVSYCEKAKILDNSILFFLGQFLNDELLNLFREKCISIEHDKPQKLDSLKFFFDSLKNNFEISIISLNYDNLIYRQFENINTGFDTEDGGKFKHNQIFDRYSWSCMLHLHGSVHFDMRQNGRNLHEIFWQNNLSAPFQQNSSGRNPTITVEENIFPTSSIIAGYGKPEQIQRFPFRIYYSEIDRLIHQSDSILFLGYGFGDSHLNIAFSKYFDDANKAVVIIDKTEDTILSYGSGAPEESSQTIKRATNLFGIAPYMMESTFPDNIKKYKELKTFERCKDRKLSIWYNGMYEACLSHEKIISELLNPSY